MKKDNVLIILPCLNEEYSILNVINQIKSKLPETYTTLVIDDGSTDNTFKIASRHCNCISLAENIGIGGAVQVGIKYALKYNFDYCIQIDGDGQHPVEPIPSLLYKCRVSDANIVIGSRYINGRQIVSTTSRYIGTRVISKFIEILYNKKIYDPTSGMRILDSKAIELFSWQYPADYPEPISISLGLKYGLKIEEHPINMRERKFGKSSISGIRTFSYMLRVISYIFLIFMQTKKKDKSND